LKPPALGTREWKEAVLYRFAGGTDGAAPLAGVLMDKTGALYGTTSAGGGGRCYAYQGAQVNPSSSSLFDWKKGAKVGCGTIFKLTPPTIGHPVWSKAVLFAFGGKDGRYAGGVPLMDKTGALYGVTSKGGEGPCGYFRFNCDGVRLALQFPTGCGTVFQLTPPAVEQNAWTLTTLHRFKSKPDGAFPVGGVIFAPDGSLLGTTGGIFGAGVGTGTYCFSLHSLSYHYCPGTVFQLTPPASGRTVWTQTILYAFNPNGSDGLYPKGGLYQDPAGRCLEQRRAAEAEATLVARPFNCHRPRPATNPGPKRSCILLGSAWTARFRQPG
jgi:hypothetical protein